MSSWVTIKEAEARRIDAETQAKALAKRIKDLEVSVLLRDKTRRDETRRDAAHRRACTQRACAHLRSPPFATRPLTPCSPPSHRLHR